uniref:Uncharacterized protein n=1 Tax=Corvus moneduloides TaxID=1196302 RepID=A0A8C3EX77_CORMO
MLILLLLGPAAWAAPRAGRSRYGAHRYGGSGMWGRGRQRWVVFTVQGHRCWWSTREQMAMGGARGCGQAQGCSASHHPSPAPPRLLWSAVRSLRPPEQDVEAMTREQALLYLFVLHDHDQSRRLDGLELLQLLGTVPWAGSSPCSPSPQVAALVDQALARQDLNGDGLLDPSELLDPPEVLLPGQGKGPPGQPPLEQQPGAVPGEGTEMPGQDLGLRSPGQAAIEAGDPQTGAPEDEAPKVESVKVESSSAEALEAEEAPEAKAPSTDAMEEEEAPEAEAPEGQGGPAWRDPGEG